MAERRRALEPEPEVGKLWVWKGDELVAVALVDPDDWERFRYHRLGLCVGYAAAQFDGRREYLHRIILGLEPGHGRGRQTDHINRDKLDNRRANLRVVSPKGNCANRGGIYAKDVV